MPCVPCTREQERESVRRCKRALVCVCAYVCVCVCVWWVSMPVCEWSHMGESTCKWAWQPGKPWQATIGSLSQDTGPQRAQWIQPELFLFSSTERSTESSHSMCLRVCVSVCMHVWAGAFSTPYQGHSPSLHPNKATHNTLIYTLSHFWTDDADRVTKPSGKCH